MLNLRLALPLLLLLALPTFGQNSENEIHRVDSTEATRWSLEGRLGFAFLGLPMTIELQSHLARKFSLDIGARYFPVSFYGGASYYPSSHFVMQLQSGYKKLSQSFNTDGPAFESEFYAGMRFGALIGRPSRMQFTIGLGADLLWDIDYCANCGLIDPSDFAPSYGNELSWTPFIEIGGRGFL